MFEKILIANRGEIAVRIIRACKEMGIYSVAVFSTADAKALHVELADEAICIGPPTVADSYLNMKNILNAALLTGAQAIHPGFGFLAENSTFATMCAELNIKFIGPSAEVIDRMGNKSNARQAMIAANVPVVPGSDGFVNSIEEGIAFASEIGYPVLLKATAGGGGKGMRFVYKESEFERAYLDARREAKNAFGDDRMYLEKVIDPARHIEFQILADSHGNVIHLGERECSLQRHHQKVLEESPSPFLTNKLRQEMGAASIAAAKEVGYENAGTIEYLVDKNRNFYFMEMNTRIQVEHPVTEMQTGIDIVKEQIRIAYGDPLAIQQNDITFTGHTIECRINAEDPMNDFRPSAGKVDFLHLPGGSNGLRVESSLYSGCTIPPFYDSMVAKVITHGKDRHEAIQIMRRALKEMRVKGITTNVLMQRALIKDETFLSGDFDNSYLEKGFLPAWVEREAQIKEA